MNAQQLKNSILQEAIEGRLVPQDPNDEPASVLLDKIRKEKARLVKEGILKKSELKDREILSDEVPFSIPKGWEWTKVDNIAFVTKLAGFEYTKYIASNLVSKESGIPLFKGKNVQNGTIVYEFESYIPLSLSNDLKRSQINKKCLLTPYVGTIGNIGIHNREGVFHLGSNVGKIEFYNNPTTNILEEYAKYYLMSRSGYQELTKYKKATAQESISIEAIRDVFIPIPPVEEQKRIVDKISSIFAMVEEYGKAQEALDKLNEELPERLKKSILQEAIEGRLVPQDPNDEPASELLKRIAPNATLWDNSHYGQSPQSWCVVKLGDIGKWQAGGTPKRSIKEYYGGDIPWLKTGDLNDGFITDIPEYITQAGLNNSSAKLNPRGSVLVAMYGATIGKMGILTFPATTNQACCACIEHPVVETMYLFYFLLSHRDIFISQGGGGAQPNISKEIIINTHIPLPPLAEQMRIVSKVSELLNLLDKITAEL